MLKRFQVININPGWSGAVQGGLDLQDSNIVIVNSLDWKFGTTTLNYQQSFKKGLKIIILKCSLSSDDLLQSGTGHAVLLGITVDKLTVLVRKTGVADKSPAARGKLQYWTGR